MSPPRGLFFYSQSCLMVSIHTYSLTAQLFWLHRMLHVWNTATCNELPQTTTAEAAHPPPAVLAYLPGRCHSTRGPYSQCEWRLEVICEPPCPHFRFQTLPIVISSSATPRIKLSEAEEAPADCSTDRGVARHIACAGTIFAACQLDAAMGEDGELADLLKHRFNCCGKPI